MSIIHSNMEGSEVFMVSKQDLIVATARRLRIVMADIKMKSTDDLAEVVGAKRSQASNWLQGYHLPPVIYMAALAEKTGLTLDWIYRGEQAGLTYAASIRLAAVEQDMTLPSPHKEPDPEPEPETCALPLRPRKKPPASGDRGASASAASSASVGASVSRRGSEKSAGPTAKRKAAAHRAK